MRALAELADVHIDLQLTKGLLPDDTGESQRISVFHGRSICLLWFKIYELKKY